MPWVENGTVILIGATTENPYFSVNRPLVSRSRIFQLKPLTEDDLRRIAWQAIGDPERGYGKWVVEIDPDALDHLVDIANGDARGVLNALELAVETTPPNADGSIAIDVAVAEDSIQRRAVLYDKDGDVHYDTISAFIKSLRGSDPDAALYWLAKMVYAGEDPRFIFRRMLIFCGEDVGLADPNAIRVVHACAEAFDRVGLPEGRFHLTEAVLYLATAPKSNSAMGFFEALSAVEQEREDEVPTHLRDASRDSEGFGHGEGYLYPHAYRDHWIAQQYLPSLLQGKVFYQPSDQGFERQIRDRVVRQREEQLAAMVEGTAVALPEVLTFSPTDRARDRWLQRVIGGAGAQLGALRDRVLDAAELQRHHLVLDVQAGTGLLTWEALRRAPEGGVWALAADEHTGDALRQQGAQLDELARPNVLVGRVEALPELLADRDEGALCFEAIVGRNPLTQVTGEARARIAAVLASLLAPKGRICLAQIVPRHTQRIYRLVDLSALPADLRARIGDAEEAIYAADDPWVDWDAIDLEEAFRAAGLDQVVVEVDTWSAEMLITPALLARWLSTVPDGSRPTYAQHLLRVLSPDEWALYAECLERDLLNQTVSWGSSTAYLAAAR